ncbi:MAG: DUF2101 family protein, partial [Methanobacterium sp.]
MNIFAKFGELILKLIDFIGILIINIPKIPQLIMNINTKEIRDKMDSAEIKENVTKITTNMNIAGFKEAYNNQKQTIQPTTKTVDPDAVYISGNFTSEEKEATILHLQIAGAGFLVFSILEIFNFISLTLFIILGGLISIFTIYMLFTKIKLMYTEDFNAYRDFFLMYLAVGVILIIISGNPSLTMAFSFQFFPSLSVLIYAAILVVSVFLIFRIRYSRKFTYGIVMETGKKTAHVKIEYDIRSNVKPNLYLVENNPGALEGELVKIKVEEKL